MAFMLPIKLSESPFCDWRGLARYWVIHHTEPGSHQFTINDISNLIYTDFICEEPTPTRATEKVVQKGQVKTYI